MIVEIITLILAVVAVTYGFYKYRNWGWKKKMRIDEKYCADLYKMNIETVKLRKVPNFRKQGMCARMTVEDIKWAIAEDLKLIKEEV